MENNVNMDIKDCEGYTNMKIEDCEGCLIKKHMNKVRKQRGYN